MFLKTIKLYGYYSHNIIIRNYSPRGKNPGVNHYLKLFKDENYENYEKEHEISKDPEALDDMESDFMNVHLSYKQYEQDIRNHREKIQQHIIKNKYFKDKQPNFLTYAEKEQIKTLHRSDPKEWDAEKLSESFPANVITIKKIIKAQWMPRSEKRIRDHDEAVIENWKLYKMGKFQNLHVDFQDHINKFTERTKDDLKNLEVNNWVNCSSLPRPKKKEFLSIITSCKKNQNNLKLLENSESRTTPEVSMNNNSNSFKNSFSTRQNPGSNDNEETYLIKKLKNKNQMRFQDLNLSKSNILNTNEHTEIPVKIEEQHTNEIDLLPEKFQSNEIELNESDMKLYNVTPIKDKIYIPRKLRKSGATYKVKDCYYDFDGEFLYRVPGMINN